MEQPITDSSPTADAPDWSTLTREILCPLCGYNLRGLVEPRCPECGHRSTWEMLLEEEVIHPYLFEHQPKQNLRSWRKTVWTSARRPSLFWQELLAVHRIRLLRLAAYMVSVAIVCTIAMTPILIVAALDARVHYAQQRERLAYLVNENADYRRQVLQQHPSVQAFVNSVYPPSVRFDRLWGSDAIEMLLFVSFIISVVWPIATILALLLYRASMARTRIHNGHVIRCVAYSVDVITLPLIMVGTALAFLLLQITIRPVPGWSLHPVIVVVLLTQVVMSYRLIVAYRKYLAFPHAAAAVIASQVIVILVLCKIAFVYHEY